LKPQLKPFCNIQGSFKDFITDVVCLEESVFDIGFVKTRNSDAPRNTETDASIPQKVLPTLAAQLISPVCSIHVENIPLY
jgi:hypothetical protein